MKDKLNNQLFCNAKRALHPIQHFPLVGPGAETRAERQGSNVLIYDKIYGNLYSNNSMKNDGSWTIFGVHEDYL